MAARSAGAAQRADRRRAAPRSLRGTRGPAPPAVIPQVDGGGGARETPGVLRWLLALSLALAPAGALAQEGGLGVSTVEEDEPSGDEGGLGVSTGEDEPSGDEGGLGVSTGEDEPPGDEGGLGVSTGEDEPSGDEEGLGVSTRETEPPGDGGGPTADGGEPADGAGPDGGRARPEGDPGEDAASAGSAEAEDAGAAADDGAGDGADAGEASAARWTDERVIGWGLFAGSVAVGVLGAVLLAVGVDDMNTVENAPGGTDWEQVAGAYDRAPVLSATGAVVLGLGVVGAAVGAGVLAAWGGQGTWLEVTALPGGVQVRGRF